MGLALAQLGKNPVIGWSGRLGEKSRASSRGGALCAGCGLARPAKNPSLLNVIPLIPLTRSGSECSPGKMCRPIVASSFTGRGGQGTRLVLTRLPAWLRSALQQQQRSSEQQHSERLLTPSAFEVPSWRRRSAHQVEGLENAVLHVQDQLANSAVQWCRWSWRSKLLIGTWQQEMQLRNARHRGAAACRRRRFAPTRPRTPSPAVSSASITPAAGGTRPSAHGYATGCPTSRAAAAAGARDAEQSRTSWSRPDAPSASSWTWRASVVPHAMGARGRRPHRERAVLGTISRRNIFRSSCRPEAGSSANSRIDHF